MIYRNLLQQLGASMQAMSDDPEAALKSLERDLELSSRGNMPFLSVPNLVVQVGPEKAGAFFRKALIQGGVQLQFGGPNETTRLAQKLALELVDQLKSPPWELVNSLDSVELYEALDKRFGQETNNTAAVPGLPGVTVPMDDMGEMGKVQAQFYYLLGLIAKDRAKDAVVVAKKLGGERQVDLPEEAFKEMEHAGYTVALDNFFYELLSQDPSLSFWDDYVSLAAKAGQTERMLTLARAAAGRDTVSDRKKAAIRETLFKALLAADAVDEGVAEIRQLIASDTLPPQRGYSENIMDKGHLGLILAQIGVLLHKPEWTQEGVGVVKTWLAKSEKQDEYSWQASSMLGSLAGILFKVNQGPEAEAVLTDALARSLRAGQSEEMGFENSLAPQILEEMAALYHRAGREQDVLDLLEQSPDWRGKDLSDAGRTWIGEREFGMMPLHATTETLPLSYLAANALIATGRGGEAGKIVDELLNREPGLDRGYELLIALKGTNALGRMDELFARDQFEERPLIWKAHLLRQLNQFEAAEKTVRQAIAIDPSDGEEGRGDRMRAYAELAEIREARGDQKDANFYREIVKAIRLSEDADQFYTAGLLKRAVAMYEEGLTHFSDAYCIQSRLAIQLSALGQNEAAEEHYRRAYELMPDSFGRVESHCFGCERAFAGERPLEHCRKGFHEARDRAALQAPSPLFAGLSPRRAGTPRRGAHQLSGGHAFGSQLPQCLGQTGRRHRACAHPAQGV